MHTSLAPAFGRPRRLAIAGVSLIVSFAFVPVLPAGAATGRRTRQDSTAPAAAIDLVERSRTAASERGSVHGVTHLHQGNLREVFVADISRAAAARVITRGTATAGIRFVDGVVYLRGNAAGLAAYFGMPPRIISKLGNRWIAIKSGEKPYDTIAQGVTFGAILSELRNLTRLSNLTMGAPFTRHGTRVIAISGDADQGNRIGSITLYVRARGKPLPVALSGTVNGVESSVEFTHWGERVRVDIPRRSVPAASLNPAAADA